MSKLRVVFNADPILYFKSMTDFFRSADTALYEASLETYQQTTPYFLDALTLPGASVQYPLDWASPQQRAAVRRKLRAQGNLPYRRSGSYQRGWTISVVQDTRAVMFALTNPTAWARWVGGTLDWRNTSPGIGQQPMFRGRWQPSQTVATQWANAVIANMTDNFSQRMRAAARVRRQQVIYG